MIGLVEEVLHMLSYLHIHHNNNSGDSNSNSNDNEWLVKTLEKEILLTIQLFFTYANNDNNNNDFMKEIITCFANTLPILIPKLLSILSPITTTTTTTTRYDAKCRAVALECLSVLPRYLSYPIIHPYRKIVVKGLIGVLNDPKRAIRSLAAQVRNAWILME